jgi:isoquinoline 1-oxidoreductase beta subunit
MSAHDRRKFAPSRRAVLGAGLVVGFTLVKGRASRAAGAALPQERVDPSGGLAPNAFVRIDPTGPVRLVLPSVEMGQGAYTGEATLLAEELDVGLDQVELEHAPPNDALYKNPFLGQQATGGSTTIRVGWTSLRHAGATVRTMLVEAAAAQWGVDPSACVTDRGVVSHPPSGRSATYGSLVAAAQRRPPPAKVTVKDPKAFKIIGKSVKRLDTPAKVNGSMIYGIDVRVPGMKVATVVSCPTFGGTVKAVDDTQARAIPGVREVVRLESSVAVIGDHFWAAKRGVDALKVEWDLGPHQDFSTASLVKALDAASRAEHPTTVMREVGHLAASGTSVEAIYQQPMLAHAALEPINAVVHVRPDACEIWCGTQVPPTCVDEAMKASGLPAERIILHNHYIGGGFGRRLYADSIGLAVQIAKAVDYPVKMIWTREHDIQHDIPRPYYYDRIAAKLDPDGRPVAWTDRVTSDSVLRRFAPPAFAALGKDGDITESAAEPPYDLPNLRAEWVDHPMPQALKVGWWRGVGPTHNLFKVESFLDECAAACRQDPVAYRRMLLHKNPRALGVLNLAVEKMGPASARGGDGLRVGRGVALGAPFGSFICTVLDVAVTPQGEVRLLRAVAAIDCGLAINPDTIQAQIEGGLVFGWTAALYGELTYVGGAAQQSNFHDYPMMRIHETPPIAVHVVASAETPGGIGEVGTAIAAPVLANAICAATGVRFRKLPVDRSQLVANGAARRTVLAEAAPFAAVLAAGGAAALTVAAAERESRPESEADT